MDRLAGRIRVMHRFIADATHQIQTPLTALASQIELLRDEQREDRRARQIQRLYERISELSRLATQLLSHAMVIHRSEAATFETVDLIGATQQALKEAVPLSLERPLQVDFNAPAEPVWILGDRVSLHEAIKNLINNAIQHGAITRLAVTVGCDENRRWVKVADDGPGIPPANWSTVREPFGSRKLGSKIGTGLGLTIVDDVAKAHSGAVSFQQRDQDADGPAGLFAVILSFPIPTLMDHGNQGPTS
jgi:two-component system, OmpR family, sensor histidine kinase TctE